MPADRVLLELCHTHNRMGLAIATDTIKMTQPNLKLHSHLVLRTRNSKSCLLEQH